VPLNDGAVAAQNLDEQRDTSHCHQPHGSLFPECHLPPRSMFKSVTSGPLFEPQYSLQYSIDVVEHPDFVTTMDGVWKCYQDLAENRA
jgi:hypothetical protein